MYNIEVHSSLTKIYNVIYTFEGEKLVNKIIRDVFLATYFITK